jgi:hypothetical protein
MKKLLLLFFTITTIFANAQNTALNFDGTNDYVNLGANVADNIRSIECWFKPTTTITSLADAQGLVYRWNGGTPANQNNVGLFIGASNIGDNGKVVFQRNINTTVYKVVSDASTWTAGVWYHVAGVIDPVNGMELYIDGVKQQDTNSSSVTSSSNNDILVMGRWGSSSNRYFNGSIDEVRVWNRAISSSEINTNKCTTIDPTTQTGLAGYWRLDEGTGSIANGMNTPPTNGAISGATWTTGSPCIVNIDQNTVLNFDGTNDYVDLGANVADNIRSIECWFKPTTSITSLSDAQGLVYRWNGGSPSNQNNVGLFIGASNIGDNGKVVFQRNMNTTVYKVVSDASTWTAGVWYHVAGVIDPVNGMELYINGVKQQDTNSSSTASSSNNDILAIGRWGSSSNRYFNGSIDEVRVWDRAISQSEINTNKCDTINPSIQTNLKGYWRLNDGIGLIANDLSGTPNNGSISGAIWEVDSLLCISMVGINEITTAKTTTLHIYPNPTSNWLNVELSIENSNIITLEVVSITGQVLSAKTTEGNTTSINVTSLPSGVYFIRAWQDNMLVDTQKFIKR